MENLSSLINEVIGKAEAQASQIIADSEAAAILTLGSVDPSTEEIVGTIMREAENRGQEIIKRAKVQASLSVRNEMLERKSKWVSDVLSQLPDKLHALNDKDYKAMIRGFVISIAPSGLVKVIPATADKGLFDSNFVKALNEVMDAREQDTTFILTGETVDVEGGIILEGENVTVNCSLASICDSYSDVLEPLVSDAMFVEGNSPKELSR